MKQICIIHGGSTYASQADFKKSLQELDMDYSRLLYRRRWNNWLGEQLPDHDVLLPSMPNNANAQYDEWAVYFSKIVPFLFSSATLIGHSLGGIFLTKYLQENPPAEPYRRLILVAAPYDDDSLESLGDFKLNSARDLSQAATEIHLFHSHDDTVVPFEEVNKYAADLPHATIHAFDDRGHFNTPTLPEIIEVL